MYTALTSSNISNSCTTLNYPRTNTVTTCPNSTFTGGYSQTTTSDYIIKTDYPEFHFPSWDEMQESFERCFKKQNDIRCLDKIGGGVTGVRVFNDRAVIVKFKDGTSTKAVCDKEDTFCLETGVTICLMKKMLGGQEEGTRLYSKILRGAVKVYHDTEKKEAEEQAAKEAEKQKRRKAELKRAAKKVKRKEEAIDIQRQGYLRAMQDMRAREDDLK